MMFRVLLLSTLSIMMMPRVVLAGTYEALCNGSQKCEVKISGDRLMAGDRIVPIQAIASWAKSGPGKTLNSTAGSILGILINFPAAQVLASDYRGSFDILYYTAEQKPDQLSVAFLNENASRFFEIEIQAATGLPQKVLNDKASQFKWTTTDFPPPQNTNSTP